MSLSALHIKHGELLETDYSDIETARQDVENSRSGAVTDYFGDYGGEGFLYQDVQWYSVFLVKDGVVYECKMYRQYPVD